MTDLVHQAGWALVAAYLFYAVFFLFLPTLLGVHVLVLITVALHPTSGLFRRAPPDSRGGLRVAAECVYGFANPLFYLLLIVPFLPWRSGFDRWLLAFAWMLFLAIWAARLLVPRDAELGGDYRRHLHRLCVLGLACLVVFALRDLVGFVQAELRSGIDKSVQVAMVTPLYLTPMLLLNHRRRLVRSGAPSGFFLASRAVARPVAVVAAAVVVVSVAAAAYRPPADQVRARTLERRDTIKAASERYGVDPALIAAIVYVTQREQIGPTRLAFEHLVMEAFVLDSTSHMGLSRSMNLSIGLAQIKPVTAMTALSLCQRTGKPWKLDSKHLRDVPALGAEWKLPFGTLPCCTEPDPLPESKPAAVNLLFSDEGNIAFAAMLVSLYQTQWRLTNVDWDISRRPEILATLYQIGFERSHPHASPRSNDFGDRVREVYGQPWIQEHFAYGP